MLRQGKTQQDRLNQLQADVSDGERRCHQTRLLFEDMGRLMRVELERFENEKVEDFKSGVETFLEGAVEAQKEVSLEICILFIHLNDPKSLFVYPHSQIIIIYLATSLDRHPTLSLPVCLFKIIL